MASHHTTATRPRLLWITHLPAPYRIPVWRHLASKSRIRFAFTESDRKIGQIGSENRTKDWAASQYPDLATTNLRTVRLRYRWHPLYVLAPFSRLPRLRLADAVLIGGWEAPAYWQVLLLAKLRGVRTVGFYESTLATHRFRTGIAATARGFFFRSLDMTVVPGVAAADAVASLGVPRDRIAVGFNAVDVRDFHDRAFAARASLGPQDGHRFVYVGQLIPRKRVDAVIRAFAEMAATNDRLTIIGGGESADLLHRLAEEHAPGRIDFRPTVLNADLPPLLADQHTLLLVSDEEVWGLVANEGLAAGLHVVVSDNCGVAPSIAPMRGTYQVREDLSDLVEGMRRSRDGFTGFIRDPEILKHTPEAFAETFFAALAPQA